jgi:outer membrane protein assembly factor BamE
MRYPSSQANPYRTMRLRSPLLLLTALLALAGCFKPEIRQGNFLSDDKIAQVKPGMTQAQVQFILGPAMVRDPQHPERWDYVRYVNPNDGDPEQNWQVVVYFDAGKVSRVEQPEVKNKEQQLQLPTVKDATDLPPDYNQQEGSPPPPSN